MEKGLTTISNWQVINHTKVCEDTIYKYQPQGTPYPHFQPYQCNPWCYPLNHHRPSFQAPIALSFHFHQHDPCHNDTKSYYYASKVIGRQSIWKLLSFRIYYKPKYTGATSIYTINCNSEPSNSIYIIRTQFCTINTSRNNMKKKSIWKRPSQSTFIFLG